jgi:hypothetical protein
MAVPTGEAIGKVVDATMIKNVQQSLTLFETVVGDLAKMSGNLPETRSGKFAQEEHERLTGPALRALHTFLDKVDENHQWGGLHKVPTPDGNIFWLCKGHRQEYEEATLLELEGIVTHVTNHA